LRSVANRRTVIRYGEKRWRSTGPRCFTDDTLKMKLACCAFVGSFGIRLATEIWRKHGGARPQRGPLHDRAVGAAICPGERLRRHVRRPAGSCRVDETYVRVDGRWTYLYRAVDSAGDTIDFLLSPKRDAVAAKLFLQLALRSGVRTRPGVINVVGHQAYAHAITELKRNGELGRRCRYRRCPYLKNVVAQDHRFLKKGIAASLGFRSVQGALNTVDAYEAMHMIRKGQVRWLAKGDVLGQRAFIHTLFGIAV